MTGYKIKGLRCPNGGCPNPVLSFTVAASYSIVLDTDEDIIDEDAEPAYDEDTHCICNSCLYSGEVIDFRATPEDYIIYPRPTEEKPI